MEHSQAYKWFFEYINATDIDILRDGVQENTLERIYPWEREEVEQVMLKRCMLPFMHKLTIADGVLAVERSYVEIPKPSVYMYEVAEYLFIHTSKRQYFKDVVDYNNRQNMGCSKARIRALYNLIPYLNVQELEIVYKIMRECVMTEKNKSILSFCPAAMAKCFDKKSMMDSAGRYKEPWRALVLAMENTDITVRIEAIKQFELLVKEYGLNTKHIHF